MQRPDEVQQWLEKAPPAVVRYVKRLEGAKMDFRQSVRDLLRALDPEPEPSSDGFDPVEWRDWAAAIALNNLKWHRDEDSAPLFYIQDTRSVVGNCAVWWCPDRGGYTCDLTKAGLYDEAEAREITSNRKTDVAYRREDVMALVVRHVRSEALAPRTDVVAFRDENGLAPVRWEAR